MTRADAKATLVALSLVATVGGWAVLAGRDRAAALASSARVAPSAALNGTVVGQPAAPMGGALAPAPPTVAATPRPVARTRSSR